MTITRPKDGMYSRFTGPVMDQICALAPRFGDVEANAMYRRLRKLKRFQKHVEAQADWCAERGYAWPNATLLPERVSCLMVAYRCTEQVGQGGIELLTPERANPMELLHILAHYLQPHGGPWHGGEFGAIFLDLIERQFDAEMKRTVKDIMLANKIKTSVRSPQTREKQTERFYERKIAQAPAGLARVLREMRELKAEHE